MEERPLPQAPAPPPAPGARPPWLARAVALALVAGAIGLVTSTYGALSQTWDEPAHIGCGMEWLDRGTFTLEPLTPPLARVAAALGPWLAGGHSHGIDDVWLEGNAILGGGAHYVRTLALARAGMLPFLLLGAWVVWAWARRRAGEAAALAALALFLTLPPVLGHAGLAATDFPLAATFAVALYAFTRWLEEPGAGRAALAGGAAALATLAKFSALPFLALSLPLLALASVVGGGAAARRERLRAAGRAALPALAAFALVVGAGYRFAAAPLVAPGRPHPGIERRLRALGPLEPAALAALAAPVWPPRAFVQGLRALPRRNREGHKAYLNGETFEGTRPAFFPEALLLKTPLPFLALVAGALAWLVLAPRRRRDGRAWAPFLGAFAVVAVAMAGRLDLGSRLVLPVYPLLAVAAGEALAALAARGRAAALLAAALLLAQGVGTLRARPEFMAWFNALAGPRPEERLVDSDLDWGQDLYALRDTLRARGVDSLVIAYAGSADLAAIPGLPPSRDLAPGERARGWVAISAYRIAEGRARDRPPLALGYRWIRAYAPVARVGRAMFLYHLPDSGR